MEPRLTKGRTPGRAIAPGPENIWPGEKPGEWEARNVDSYIIQANNFLRKHGIKFSAKPTDSGNCPQWRENCDHIHGDEHRARFSREGKSFSVLFWNSYEDARRGHQVEAYDVLSCLQKYDPGDFSEFCSEYGYDEDSRRDEKTWRAVVREWRKVEKFFSPEELTELQEIQ